MSARCLEEKIQPLAQAACAADRRERVSRKTGFYSRIEKAYLAPAGR